MSTTTIGIIFRVDGVLTDVTSATLSDPTGAFGVERLDNNAVIVADGTPLVHISTGVYEYELTDPAPNLIYHYYVEVVRGGATYFVEKSKSGPAAIGAGAEQIERARQVLLNALFEPLGLTAGNCLVMDEPRVLPDMGRLYVELFDDGGRPSGGDSTLIEHWTLGVAIFAALSTDQNARAIAASRELRTAAHYVRDALHMHYDGDYWPEPIRYLSRSRIKTVHPGLRSIELRFDVISIEEYATIINTANT